jgi:type IV pilus assembly protein PilV
LLEALVAILVFAIGTLGVFALAGHALRESAHAHWRIEAADLASSIVARMLTEDPATLAPRYDPVANGAGFQDLLAAAERLPGVTAQRNAPSATFAAGPSAGSLNVSLSLFWQAPGDALPHRHLVTAVVAR